MAGKKTGWTPGPWVVTTCLDYWVCAAAEVEGDGPGIAHCGDIHWPGWQDKQVEWAANAILIAAAPDLFEALASAAARLERLGDVSTPQLLKARAALAKALADPTPTAVSTPQTSAGRPGDAA
jgi:hypothetical protein